MLGSSSTCAGYMAAKSSQTINVRPGPRLFQYLRLAAKRRSEMIFDLANLRDDAKAEDWFWRRWQRVHTRTNWNRPLSEYREELRRIWSVPLSLSREWGTVADVHVRIWLDEAQRPKEPLREGYATLRPTWTLEMGCVFPDYRNLPLSLAVGVSELAHRMAICENPECPSRYFLKGRSKQRFCELPACIRYGQREHKKRWWAEHGKQWKEERQKDH
jgi:hypothetical protein